MQQASRAGTRRATGWRTAPERAARVRAVPCRCSTIRHELTAERELPGRPGVYEGYWKWNDEYRVRYQRCGDAGPALVLVHGFGGNADHWRKNIAVLGQRHRVWAIDLLGYGFSDKPAPVREPPNGLYSFDTWGQQIVDFASDVVGGPAFCITNSVGGVAGLVAAMQAPHVIKGVQLMDISLRGLHEKRTGPLLRPFVAALQSLLRDTPLGAAFFSSVATPESVRSILRQAYCDPATVTDELVQAILDPGLQPGALDVFLDFISYSGGPLPEDLLAACKVPVSIVWGVADPWEDVVQARKLFAPQPCVEEFVELPGVGHCPMDEAPHLVNPLIERFVARHSGGSSNGSSNGSSGAGATGAAAGAGAISAAGSS